MAIRTVVDCDRCGADGLGRHMGPYDTGDGNGPRMVDICGQCEADLGIPELQVLLLEFGVKLDKEVAKARDKALTATVRCPVCRLGYTTRKGAIDHVVSRHGQTHVEASHLVRPFGQSEECPTCGMLCALPSGLRIHISTMHPDVES